MFHSTRQRWYQALLEIHLTSGPSKYLGSQASCCAMHFQSRLQSWFTALNDSRSLRPWCLCWLLTLQSICLQWSQQSLGYCVSDTGKHGCTLVLLVKSYHSSWLLTSCQIYSNLSSGEICLNHLKSPFVSGNCHIIHIFIYVPHVIWMKLPYVPHGFPAVLAVTVSGSGRPSRGPSPTRRSSSAWPFRRSLGTSETMAAGGSLVVGNVYVWLVVWNMVFMTFHILGITIPRTCFFPQ